MSDSVDLFDRQGVEEMISALFQRPEALVESITRDGWPRKMVREGLRFHRRSWDPKQILRNLGAELALFKRGGHRITWPREIHHIWPALPGAGVAPVLVAKALAIPQKIRVSSRGKHFGNFFSEVTGVALIDEEQTLFDAEVLVVSGSDETIKAIDSRKSSATRQVAYGHRISFGVLVDGPEVDLQEVATRASLDVVLWHQEGCFSLRGVVFIGSCLRAEEFGQFLARAIAEREVQWEALQVSAGALSARAQALGMAEMKGPVFQEGLGFVTLTAEPFRGKAPAIHSVSLHQIEKVADLQSMLEVPARQVQGVAFFEAKSTVDSTLEKEIASLGATRICSFGALQAPPPWWWHDGLPNGLSLGRITTLG